MLSSHLLLSPPSGLFPSGYEAPHSWTNLYKSIDWSIHWFPDCLHFVVFGDVAPCSVIVEYHCFGDPVAPIVRVSFIWL